MENKYFKNTNKIKLFSKKIILSILFTLMFMFSSANAFSFRNMTLDFVQLTDTHISTDREDTAYKALGSSQALLKDAIEQINQIKGLDFIMFTGDMVDSATSSNYEAFYRLLSKSKYPSLNTFGNHDFYNVPKSEALKAVKHYNPNYIFDNTYYAFTPKTDYRIIVLDAVMKNITTANGELSQEQLDFLDRELEANKDKVVLIALHHPSVEPFISQEHAMFNANAMNQILAKYKNPIIVISGHYHAARINVVGNIIFVSSPALVTYPMAFRHIKITNYKDRVKYEFDFIPTRLDEVKEKNRQNVISYSTLSGNEKDRVLTYTFNKKHAKSTKYKEKKIENLTKEAKATEKELKKYDNSNKKTIKQRFEEYQTKRLQKLQQREEKQKQIKENLKLKKEEKRLKKPKSTNENI